MNTMTTSTSLRGLIATVIFSALASNFATVCASADPTDPPKVVVKYGDLNLSTPEGAIALYRRIRAAADEVCSAFDHGDLMSKMHMKACTSKAAEAAVVKVNETALFAIYNSKNGTQLPSTLVSQNR